MKHLWIKINSYLAMVKAMRRGNFVTSQITYKDEIYVCLQVSC